MRPVGHVPWNQSASTLLANEHVELHPISEADREPLRAIAFDDRIWKYFVSRVEDDADFEKFFDAMLADQSSGKRVCYIVLDKGTGEVAGSSSYGNLSEADLRLEIGWSWLGVDYQGKGVNRWVKYLLLQHAFDVLGAERVEFKTDVLNAQARAGLRNIGAYEEGVLRSFNPMPEGRRRDAIYYSVLRAEWPSVQDQLRRLGKAGNPCA
jgi:RimJ/RimL family protein N-acetyltransferase